MNVKRMAQFGRKTALVFGLGLALQGSLLPASGIQSQVAADQDGGTLASGEYVHVDYARKKLICEPRQAANSTALIEDWRLPDGGMKYWVNTASIPVYLDQGQVLSAVDLAAQTWRAAGAPGLSSDGQTDTAGTITDGKNTISFGATRLDAVGLATMRIKDGIVQEADIVLDVTSLWATNPTSVTGCGGAIGSFDVQNVLTHEFGHWVGAQHPKDGWNGNKWRTMYSDIAPGEVFKRTLTAGDTNSIPSAAVAPSSFSGTVTRAGDDDG